MMSLAWTAVAVQAVLADRDHTYGFVALPVAWQIVILPLSPPPPPVPPGQPPAGGRDDVLGVVGVAVQGRSG
jgi:hypothetical protein